MLYISAFQHLASGDIADVCHDPPLYRVRGIPFLKLLVLKRDTGRITGAHEHVIIYKDIKYCAWLGRCRNLSIRD